MISGADSGTGSSDQFSETQDRVTRVIADALAEVESTPGEEAAFAQASWLVETLRHATITTGAVRLKLAVRIQESGRLSLSQLGQRIGVSKARAAEMIQAAKRKDSP